MVYGALQQELASEAIHALALNTSTLRTLRPPTLDLSPTMDAHQIPHRNSGRFQPDLCVHEGLEIDAPVRILKQCGPTALLGVAFETFDVL